AAGGRWCKRADEVGFQRADQVLAQGHGLLREGRRGRRGALQRGAHRRDPPFLRARAGAWLGGGSEGCARLMARGSDLGAAAVRGRGPALASGGGDGAAGGVRAAVDAVALVLRLRAGAGAAAASAASWAARSALSTKRRSMTSSLKAWSCSCSAGVRG